MPFMAATDGTNTSLIATYVAFLIVPGFCLLTCGLVQRKNAAHLVMLTFSGCWATPSSSEG
jgi:ammonia channel protein AmtB